MKALTLLFSLLLLLAPAEAAERSLAIERFDALIVVNSDGSVDVTETISARFSGQWNGIFRTIPVEYHTPQGFSWTLRLEDVHATDSSGKPLKIERERERHYLKYKIWVPGANNATHAIRLHYRAANGLRFFDEHDELYWNITGDEWDVPIGAVYARIELPAAVTGVRAIAFDGPYGATAQNARVEISGPTIRIEMPEALGFRAGLTAVIGWNKGAVAEPSSLDKASAFLASNWPLGLPVLVFLFMYHLWRKVGRDPEQRPISAQYAPPAELTPAEAGTLIDEKVDMRDITATIVDLAVNGHLRIEELSEKKLFGLVTDTDYVFHRLQPAPGSRALAQHEQLLLAGLFESAAQTVKLSDLQEEFYTHLSGIKTALFKRLVERGLYRSRPDQVRGMWIAAAIVAGIALLVGGIALGKSLGMTGTSFVIAAVLSAVTVGGFGYFMPARTLAGARAYESVRGFEEFLRRVESDRYARVEKTPEMFEKFLPYAMAFGVEAKWARAFNDIYREPPKWYSGSNMSGFNAANFSSRIASLASSAGSTMSSSPRSSGGSGFSGGGSSGGGSGGGGGGGF